MNMRIENEMLSRFNKSESLMLETSDRSLSCELDFFLNNVMDSVVEYFSENQEVKI